MQNLSGLVDLQKSSSDFVPGLAANLDEGLESKEGEQLGDQTCRRGQVVQHQCKVSSTETQIPPFTFPPCIKCAVNSTGNYSLFLEPKNVLDV